MFRVFAIGLLACASLLGASANSSHQARAAAHTAAATTLQVSSVTAWVNNGAWNGQCASWNPFTFLGIITFPAGNPGGQVTYFWTHDSWQQPSYNVTIQPGQTEQKVYDTWPVSAAYGDGHVLSNVLNATVTNGTSGANSNYVRISLVCPFSVGNPTGSVSPITWCPTPIQKILNGHVTMSFSFTLPYNPGPPAQISYTITQTEPSGPTSPGTGSPASPVTVYWNATSVPVSSGWTISANAPPGPYSEVLAITSPAGGYASIPVTSTKTC